MWDAKANPHAPAFGLLRFDDPDLAARAKAALAEAQAEREAMCKPFETRVDPATLYLPTCSHCPRR